MPDALPSFLPLTFLRSVWEADYLAFRDSPEETALLETLTRWSEREDLRETSAEPAFISTFFTGLWGYTETGTTAGQDFTLYPKFAVAGAGAGGNTGQADLAMGHFGDGPGIPQVLCEYKSIRSTLDAPQPRKGNQRSPVQQALDYLSFARRGMVGSEALLPTWALVSDMNEFRLYWFDRGKTECARFIIQKRDLFEDVGLLEATEEARFARFAFKRMFRADMLLSHHGRCELLRLVHERRLSDKRIEESYYQEYRALREHLFTTLLAHNGPGTDRYPGTHGRLLRLAQKLLDRILFVAFCDDMGARLGFPPNLLRDMLDEQSKSRFFEPGGDTVWPLVKRLFATMDKGGPLAGGKLPRFNGGLFEKDDALDRLDIPNGVFCQHRQGFNQASLHTHKLTVF